MLDPLINILTSNTSLPSLWGRTIVIVALFVKMMHMRRQRSRKKREWLAK